MIEPLKHTIKLIVERYQKHKDRYRSNETATRDQLINPLLTVLGWDTSNPEYVFPNLKNTLGEIPDYTLHKNSQKVLVMEAKNASVDIRNVKVINQLSSYAYNMGIHFGMISNGLKWLLFNTFQHDPAERTVWVVDFENSHDNYEHEAKKLTVLAYSNIEVLGKNIEKAKFLDNFWASNLASQTDLVRFISSSIKEKAKKEIALDLKEIEEFVKNKLGIHMAEENRATAYPAETPKIEPERNSTEAGFKKRSRKTNIKVTFADGTVIHNNKASITFAKVIEKVGVEIVKKLHFRLNGSELISPTADKFRQQQQINGGYVAVHSSTMAKLKVLNAINQSLNLNLKIETEQDH